jgi:GT2 family glycosyltransferase
MTVSVIIVTIGRKDYLKDCLASLAGQSCPPSEIIVVDNSLNPGFFPEMNKLYPFLKRIQNQENLFYAAGMNQGIKLSRGEIVLCINDDIILDKNFIQEALKGFLVQENIGMVGAKLLRREGKILDSTGLFLSLWRTAGERGYGQSDRGQFDRNGYIFGASGAAAFYRRRMLEEIKDENGYFDLRFKMFYEDLDLAWRANRRGWRGYYIFSAVAYHVRGGSTRPDSGIDQPIARRHLNNSLHCRLIKNRYLTILKNEIPADFILHLIPVLIYEACVWIYVLIFCPGVFKIFLNRNLTAAADLKDGK